MTEQQTADTSADLTWFKSSHSGTDGGECVEVANTLRAAHVRDSKTASGPVLTFEPADWSAFLARTAALGD